MGKLRYARAGLRLVMLVRVSPRAFAAVERLLALWKNGPIRCCSSRRGCSGCLRMRPAGIPDFPMVIAMAAACSALSAIASPDPGIPRCHRPLPPQYRGADIAAADAETLDRRSRPCGANVAQLISSRREFTEERARPVVHGRRNAQCGRAEAGGNAAHGRPVFLTGGQPDDPTNSRAAEQ